MGPTAFLCLTLPLCLASFVCSALTVCLRQWRKLQEVIFRKAACGASVDGREDDFAAVSAVAHIISLSYLMAWLGHWAHQGSHLPTTAIEDPVSAGLLTATLMIRPSLILMGLLQSIGCLDQLNCLGRSAGPWRLAAVAGVMSAVASIAIGTSHHLPEDQFASQSIAVICIQSIMTMIGTVVVTMLLGVVVLSSRCAEREWVSDTGSHKVCDLSTTADAPAYMLASPGPMTPTRSLPGALSTPLHCALSDRHARPCGAVNTVSAFPSTMCTAQADLRVSNSKRAVFGINGVVCESDSVADVRTLSEQRPHALALLSCVLSLWLHLLSATPWLLRSVLKNDTHEDDTGFMWPCALVLCLSLHGMLNVPRA